MSHNLKRVLLLFTDKYYLVKQIYPFGLDIIANYLRQHGYDVTVDYPFLPEPDLETNLKKIIKRYDPDLIGLGIRNLDTAMSCEQFGNHEGQSYKTFYFLPQIKQIAEKAKRLKPEIPIIAGGGAFTVSPIAILKMLGLEYGIVGEGEEPLRQFLEAYPDKEKLYGIPNLAFQRGDGFHINPRQSYSFKKSEGVFVRERKFNYAYETAGLPVQVKRGCNRNCSYCVEPFIEEKNFVFKKHDDVIDELKEVAKKHVDVHNIFFTDTEFNIPSLEYCAVLINKIIKSGLHEHFRFSSQFLSRPFDAKFAKLLSEAGFSIILTCDSFSDHILKKNRSSYRRRDIVKTLQLCEQLGIDCTINLIFGLPGETYETINHTLNEIIKYPPGVLRRYEYTIGGRIYQDTPLCRLVEKEEVDHHLYGKRSEGYLKPCYYCSPESPFKIKAYIENDFPFPMEYQNNYDEIKYQILALSYLVDQSMWDVVADRFLKSNLDARTSIYDYLFRKLIDAGRTEMAKRISEHLLEEIFRSEMVSEYSGQVSVIQHYLTLIEQKLN